VAVNKSVEMRLSERYHATRRNYLFSVTLLLVLTIAAPAKIHIPGFGEEAQLASALGFVGLWLAALMFGYDFYVEHALSKIRNSDVLVAVEDEDIVRGLRSRVDALAGLTRSLEKRASELDRVFIDLDRAGVRDAQLEIDRIVEKLRPALDEPMMLLKTMDHLPFDSNVFGSKSAFAAYVKQFEKPFEEILKRNLAGPYNEVMRQRTHDQTILQQAMTKIAADIPALKQAIEEDGGQLDRLTSEFRRVGSAVHRTQRIAFKFKDTWLSWLLFGGVTVAMLWRVVPQVPWGSVQF